MSTHVHLTDAQNKMFLKHGKLLRGSQQKEGIHDVHACTCIRMYTHV